MSGPLRQKLAEVNTVTPTLGDKVVTIQNNTVKTSLYSAIYNLFKVGYDLIYLTSSDLINYATKAYADSAALGAEANANNYTDGIASTLLSKFNVNNNNNDVGNIYSGNLNGETGTILLTGVIAPNSSETFSIGNDLCTPNSRITDLGLLGVNDLNICGYVPTGNAFFVTVRNNTGANVSGFRLTFRINN